MDNNQNMQQMNVEAPQVAPMPETPAPQPEVQAAPMPETPVPQQMFSQAPMQQPMYTQAPQQMYGQAPQQMYGQAPMQQMYGQQPPQAYGQMYGYSGYTNNGYNPYKQPKAAGDFAGNVKKAKKEFTGKVSKMGISAYCLMGIIAAMLCIFGPFMNFASIHVSTKVDASEMLGSSYGYGYDYDYDDIEDFDFGKSKSKAAKYIKLKASDGMNLFELSKLSGTTQRVLKQMGESSSDLADQLDASEGYVLRYLDDFNDEYGANVKRSSVKELFGTGHLLLKGRLALLLTPFIVIICGIGLFFFTIINKKAAKIVFAAVPLACIIWLMICSSNFFSLMGIGAWAIIIGAALGLVSAFMEKSATN